MWRWRRRRRGEGRRLFLEDAAKHADGGPMRLKFCREFEFGGIDDRNVGIIELNSKSSQITSNGRY
jgi:hypothetical protein